MVGAGGAEEDSMCELNRPRMRLCRECVAPQGVEVSLGKGLGLCVPRYVYVGAAGEREGGRERRRERWREREKEGWDKKTRRGTMRCI